MNLKENLQEEANLSTLQRPKNLCPYLQVLLYSVMNLGQVPVKTGTGLVRTGPV